MRHSSRCWMWGDEMGEELDGSVFESGGQSWWSLPIANGALECEELFLVLPKGHALESRRRIATGDLEGERFIMLDEEHCLSDSILTFCRQDATQPLVMERTSQLMMVQELVSLGHGVSMIPAMVKETDRSKKRVYRSLAPTRPTRRICMVWDDRRFHSRVHEAFRERVREAVRGRKKAPRR